MYGGISNEDAAAEAPAAEAPASGSGDAPDAGGDTPVVEAAAAPVGTHAEGTAAPTKPAGPECPETPTNVTTTYSVTKKNQFGRGQKRVFSVTKEGGLTNTDPKKGTVKQAHTIADLSAVVKSGETSAILSFQAGKHRNWTLNFTDYSDNAASCTAFVKNVRRIINDVHGIMTVARGQVQPVLKDRTNIKNDNNTTLTIGVDEMDVTCSEFVDFARPGIECNNNIVKSINKFAKAGLAMPGISDDVKDAEGDECLTGICNHVVQSCREKGFSEVVSVELDDDFKGISLSVSDEAKKDEILGAPLKALIELGESLDKAFGSFDLLSTRLDYFFEQCGEMMVAGPVAIADSGMSPFDIPSAIKAVKYRPPPFRHTQHTYAHTLARTLPSVAPVW